MKITKIITNLLYSNVFIIENEEHCLIIDAGAELEEVKCVIGDKKVDGILLTHGHYDHSAYCNKYAQYYETKIYANANIIQTLKDKDAIYSEDKSTIDDLSNFVFIDDDCILQIGKFEVNCFSAEGHSPCCECYLIDRFLFAGDVLFENGIGRTDLIGSSKKDMFSSLNKLEKVDFEIVLSGHGEESDFQLQKKNISIFKRFLSR